ncbi:unnamed protein product [Effrenium voratum]|nr:unnamed protein product [Effrenium voratum]
MFWISRGSGEVPPGGMAVENLWLWGQREPGAPNDRSASGFPMVRFVPVGLLAPAGAAESWLVNQEALQDDGLMPALDAAGDCWLPVPLKTGVRCRTVRMVAMGFEHCVIVTADSLMYSWGNGSKGQLGTGSMQAADTPQFITYPTDVLGVAAGEEHSACLIEGGECFTWGNAAGGRLGLGSCLTDGEQLSPKRVVISQTEVGRMVRYYNPHESALRSLFRWQYTLTSSVMRMGEFWLYMLCALSVMLLMDLSVVNLPEGVVHLDVWKLLSPQLSVTIFAVVFYNNQCYSRYMSLYSTCVDIDVNEKEFVSELLINFGYDPTLRNHVRQAAKFSLAAIFFFYLSMEDDRHLMTTWSVIQEKGLLTEAEVNSIRSFPGTTSNLLLHWCSAVVKDAVSQLRARGKPYTPPELSGISSRMYGIIDRIGACSLTVRSIQNMPVPFSYFHLLNILISFTVLATGIGSLILVEQYDAPSYCLAFFPYAVVTFVLLALRQLSGELADPFGTDDLDFPIADFMRHIYDNVVAMLVMADRYDPVESLQKGTGEFTPEMIKRPCEGPHAENPLLTAILQKQASRMQSLSAAHQGSGRKSWRRLIEDDGSDVAAYGPRNWKRPEDFEGAAKLVRWMDGGEIELKAKTIGASLEEEAAVVSATPQPPKAEEKKAATPAPAAPQDASCAASLQHIEQHMKKLLVCMSELKDSLAASAAPLEEKKKDVPGRTTVKKPKKQEEASKNE